MDIDLPSNPAPTFTILRIKRKRTEEPLDALVVDANSRSRRRKTNRGALDVFQFAVTVEQDAWDDEKQKSDLQRRISALAVIAPTKNKTEENKNLVPDVVPVCSQPSKPEEAVKRYTVVKRPDQESPSRKALTAPPKVISHRDLHKRKPDFTYYDAVLASERRAKMDDEDVTKFLPMLEDYLKLSDTSHSPASARSDGDTDYVWDVFYHRPVIASEWTRIVANIGTLTGLPASFGHPNDSDSGSEVEDDEDEDSNAEDYYKNDYPDEEESDDDETSFSDEFYGSSDQEDLFANDDNESDEEWMDSNVRMR